MKHFLNDSVVLEENADFDDTTPVTITGLSWQIEDPLGFEWFQSTLPTSPVLNQIVIVPINVDLREYPSVTNPVYPGPNNYLTAQNFTPQSVLKWDGSFWQIIGASQLTRQSISPRGQLILPGVAMFTPGAYRSVATFSFVVNSVTVTRSSWDTFEVIDPFNLVQTEKERTIELCWSMLEDCFDSELGGPHLRDASLAGFDKEKLSNLFEMALFQIGIMQPSIQYTETSFPYALARPLAAKALEVEAIKHLMRSYVEQPMITSTGSITYFERRDYIDRWNTLLTIEQLQLKEWLAMFKRQQYNFGVGKLLVDNKTRGLFIPGQIRTRYPRGPIGW